MLKNKHMYIYRVEQSRIEKILESGLVAVIYGARQAKSMSLGDSIIAATALEHDLKLCIANVQDFSHIHGLGIVNPLKKLS